MAISKSPFVLMAPTNLPAGQYSKQVPLAGDTINCQTVYGGELTYKVTNGASAPTVAASLTFQVSHNGSDWYEYYTVSGDSVASSVTSGSLLLDRGVMFVRVVAYGNTVTSVAVEAHLQAITGV